MDRLHQADHKIAREQRYTSLPPQQQPTPETAPPPYTAPEQEDFDSDSESESSDTKPLPFNLTINASHNIRGSNNLIPTSASTSPLQDATRFSTLLLAAVNQINKAATGSSQRSARALKVDLTINCGVTVVGDRNVIGNVAVRPKVPSMAGPGAAVGGASVVAGAKRKVEDDWEEDGRWGKKIAGG